MANNPRVIQELLLDIKTYACKARAFLQNQSQEDFYCNEMAQYAVFHCIEVIGEAASRLPLDFRTRHGNIPWRDIIAMRNILIHEYFDINIEMAWETVKTDIPVLLQLLENLDP